MSTTESSIEYSTKQITNNVKGQSCIVFLNPKASETQRYTLSMLPRRPAATKPTDMRSGKLLSNLFRVNLPQDTFIHEVDFEIQPKIPLQNKDLYNWFVDSIEMSIANATKSTPLRLGNRIYTYVNLPLAKTVVTCMHQQDKYVCTIKYQKPFLLKDVFSDRHELNSLPLKILNRLIGDLMKRLGYNRLAKTDNYLNSSHIQHLNTSSLHIHDGYSVKFSRYQQQLYLRIDPFSKIYRSQSVLEQIDYIYSKYHHQTKEQKREMIYDLIRKRTVVASYGKKRMWRVKGVIFDQNLFKIQTCKNSSQSLADYYKEKYGIIISNKYQPLLIAESHTKRPVLLIPELLYIVNSLQGPQLSKHQRVDNYLKQTAHQKEHKIKSLMQALKQHKDNPLEAVLQSLAMSIQHTSTIIECKILPSPILMLGNKQKIEQSKIYNFCLKSKQLYLHDNTANILVVYQNGFTPRQTIQIFDQLSTGMGVKQQVDLLSLGCNSSMLYTLETVKSILRDDNYTYRGKYNAILLILNNKLKHNYWQIKHCAMASEPNFVTQLVLESTLRCHYAEARFIVSNILNQVHAKLGNTPWLVKMPKDLNCSDVMLVAFHKTFSHNNRSILAMCASVNPKITKYFSRIKYYSKQVTHIQLMSEMLKEAIGVYQRNTSSLPQTIIIMRPSFGDMHNLQIQNLEVSSLLKVIETIRVNNNTIQPRLTYLLLNLSSKETFLRIRHEGHNLSNPLCGSLITTTVTSNVHHDFYIASRYSSRQYVKSTYYKVIYNSSIMTQQCLYELLYNQCFNYLNVQGVIEVPAVCHYAKKLCRLAKCSINNIKQLFDKNSNQLFYI